MFQTICRGVFLALALLLPGTVAAQGVAASYDEGSRIWRLSNGLVETAVRLDSENHLRLHTLGQTNGRRWISDGRPAVSPVYLRIDRTSLKQNTVWELISTQIEDAERGGKRHVIELRAPAEKAEVTLRVEMHPGQPFVRMGYSYRNTDLVRRFINDARFLNLRLNAEGMPMHAFFVDQSRQGTDLMFEPHETKVVPAQRVSVRAGAHADQCTWLALRDGYDNGLALGWEFNGRSVVTAEMDGAGSRVLVRGALEAPRIPVAAGRSVDLPYAFVGLFNGDWDEAGYRTHRYVEAVLAHPLPDDNFPYVMFNSWGYEQAIDEFTLRRAADIAAEIGVEVFVVDLGWAREIGDWQEDSIKFPGGMRALAGYIRGLGMKFGLHFVPVEASPNAPVLVDNPDWTAAIDNEYFGADSLCISHGPVQSWLRRAASDVFERYAPDWITQDAENLVKVCTKATHTHNPRNSNWANSVDGLDSFIRFIRGRYPGTLWENNADGGTMSTFEAVKNYVTFSSCDACEHLPRRQAVFGMSYVFPLRYINRYMAEPPIQFTTRASMFGGPWIIMQDITRWTAFEIALMRQEVALYKSLRPLLREGKVYHLMARPTGYQNEAIESFHPDWDRGVILVYRPDTSSSSQTVYPRGLRPAGRYRVSFQESRDTRTDSGANLMSRGINVRLPIRNFAEIVYITGS